MKCPVCRDVDLVAALTREGVEVDYCERCKGIWLDKGEVYYFTKTPTYLRTEIDNGLKNPKPTSRLNPKTNEPMESISLFGGKIIIEYCPRTHGLWLDGGELEKLPGVSPKGLRIRIDKKASPERLKEELVDIQADMARKARISGVAAGLTPLPNLVTRSVVVLTGLYGILALGLIICVHYTGLTAGAALIIGVLVAAFHFITGPFILDFFLRLFFRMSWVKPADLPGHLREFIQRASQENKMRFPRMGIIRDGSPNAFTYGHHPNNARIVVSQGLLDLLGPKESEAVVAHEIGHAIHWDMLIMTMAQLVPLILFYIYRTLIRIRVRGRDKSAPYRYAIAIGSYILYIISEYLVLWFSRTREYFADRFAGQATRDPNSLASALVKIGYGLAGQEPAKATKKAEERRPSSEAIGAMGIFDSKAARTLAITGHSGALKMGEEVDKEALKDAMKWDMWNPWAKYYELHSTHPLIAHRLNYLSEQAAFLGKEPYIIFNRLRPESYWDEFAVDILIRFLPLLAILVSAAFYLRSFNPFFIKFGLFLLGGAYLVNTLFVYGDKDFPEFNIAGLLKKVKVSSVRPVPCTLRGKVIGRGIPGLIWSEDFILQDETGIVFLDYRQPLKIWEFLFGLLRAEELKDEEVALTGWYRRAPIPYIELKTLKTRTKRRTCYVYNMKLVCSLVLIALGILLVVAF